MYPDRLLVQVPEARGTRIDHLEIPMEGTKRFSFAGERAHVVASDTYSRPFG
ncbi:MAG: hypothetical protein RLY31_18 [Bacteroidota bacterium]|jgi:hypothetical protein